MSESMDESAPWGIGAIVKILQWLEKLTVVLSAPMLTLVAVSTVANAYMNGQLLTPGSGWEVAYAWCLGIGIEGQFAGTIDTAHQRQVNGLDGVWFYRFVAFLLFLVGMTTAAVVGYSEVNHVSIPDALVALGVPPLFWNWGRSFIMFGLIALSAHTRYVKKVRLTLAQELEKIEHDKQIALAKQDFNKQRLRGFAGAFKAGLDGALGREEAPIVPEIAPALAEVTTQEITENTPANVVELADPKLPENRWNAKLFRAWLLTEHNVEISEEEAVKFVKEVGGGQQVVRAFVAPIGRLRQRAVKKYRLQSPGKSSDIGGALVPDMAE